jgi:hypothetical protein
MGIDRISGGTPGVPAQDVGGASRAEPGASGFDISRPAEASPVPSVADTTAAEQVRSGQIDIATYLDRKVEEATSHLAALPAAQLDAIREALRDRLAGDPALVELVNAAAGQSPPPRNE